jgi:hypothetical protein
MKKSLLLVGTHLLAIGVGFARGIYALPILTLHRGAQLSEKDVCLHSMP